jgi:hypothetical protein
VSPTPATESTATPAWDRRNPQRSAAATRATYNPPRLRRLGDAASLLEVLGPAQANYGGPMPF